MCDWDADGVWGAPAYGSMEGFRVSPGLWARIQRWQDWYHTQNPSLDPDPAFDMEAFTAEGLLIARAVKAELPEWTVIYSDEAAWDYCYYELGPRSYMGCTYEIRVKLH